MNRIAVVAVVAVALLLTGCAASTPAATPPTRSEQFVAAVQDGWRGTLPTEKEILVMGASGCASFRAGATRDQVHVIHVVTEDDARNNEYVVSKLRLVCRYAD